MVKIQIMTHDLSVLILVKTVCLGNQQMTEVDAGKANVNKNKSV